MNSIAQTAEKLIMNINNEPVLSTGGRNFGREFKKVIYTTQSTNEHPFTDSQTNGTASQQKVKMLSDIMNHIEK
jgi:hypothetical protein